MKKIIIITVIVSMNCNVERKELAAVGMTDTTTIYSISTSGIQTNEIPAEIFEMTHLQNLTITGMDCDYRQVDNNGNDITKCWAIGRIPKEINKLKKLETLDLRLNNIQTLPEEIKELQKLRVLDLTDNPSLSNIDNVVGLRNLEELILFGCSLTTLPKEIGQLSTLKYLGLTANNIDIKEQERIKKALPKCDIKF